MVLDKIIQLILEFLKDLGPTVFPLYISDLPDDVICNIATYADDTTVLAKPYLMMLYVIFPIHLNFPVRSRCVLKGIIHRKKQWIVLWLLEKVFFFFKSTLFMILYMHVCGI